MMCLGRIDGHVHVAVQRDALGQPVQLEGVGAQCTHRPLAGDFVRALENTLLQIDVGAKLGNDPIELGAGVPVEFGGVIGIGEDQRLSDVAERDIIGKQREIGLAAGEPPTT